MSLPHFDITTFSSQLFWLFVATTCSYIFNKFFFIPHLVNSIAKRNNLIENYKSETAKMNEHIKSLQQNIETSIEISQRESKAILENAIAKSQTMLSKHLNENNILFNKKMFEYDEFIQKQKAELASNASIIVKDVKEKVLSFILSQNNYSI